MQLAGLLSTSLHTASRVLQLSIFLFLTQDHRGEQSTPLAPTCPYTEEESKKKKELLLSLKLSGLNFLTHMLAVTFLKFLSWDIYEMCEGNDESLFWNSIDSVRQIV